MCETSCWFSTKKHTRLIYYKLKWIIPATLELNCWECCWVFEVFVELWPESLAFFGTRHKLASHHPWVHHLSIKDWWFIIPTELGWGRALHRWAAIDVRWTFNSCKAVPFPRRATKDIQHRVGDGCNVTRRDRNDVDVREHRLCQEECTVQCMILTGLSTHADPLWLIPCQCLSYTQTTASTAKIKYSVVKTHDAHTLQHSVICQPIYDIEEEPISLSSIAKHVWATSQGWQNGIRHTLVALMRGLEKAALSEVLPTRTPLW